uniref:Uncharacterized protein n=1 Tax=Anas platyrhynchos TaxID=8839 RepID=A0A8B9T2H0_ANAPL
VLGAAPVLTVPRGTGVCVRGRCVPTGCDRVIGSKKKFDKCMVCGGDGSTCTKVSGVFTNFGYNDVVTIPAGATGDSGDNVYLALRQPSGGSLLNGGYVLVPSQSTVTLPGGVSLRYSGATAATETLASLGPPTSLGSPPPSLRSPGSPHSPVSTPLQPPSPGIPPLRSPPSPGPPPQPPTHVWTLFSAPSPPAGPSHATSTSPAA